MTEHTPTNHPNRRKRLIASATIGTLLGVGGLSIAAAAQAAPPQTPTTVQVTGHEQGEKPDTTYKSSVTSPEAPEGKEGTEADEQAQEQAETAALAKLATVTPAEASAAATKAVPGKAATPELSNEDGNVVYEVTITSADGTTETKVVIDAGNAKVLAQEREDADHETNEAPEVSEPAANEAPAPATGVTPGN